MPNQERITFEKTFSPETLVKNGRGNCVAFALAERNRLIKSGNWAELALVESYAGIGPTRHVTTAVLMEVNGSVAKIIFSDATPWEINGFTPWGYNQVTGGYYIIELTAIGKNGLLYPLRLNKVDDLPPFFPSPFESVCLIPDENISQLITQSPEDIDSSLYPGLWFDAIVKRAKSAKSIEASKIWIELGMKFPYKIEPWLELANCILAFPEAKDMITNYFPYLSPLNSKEISWWCLGMAGEACKRRIQRFKEIKKEANGERIIFETVNAQISRLKITLSKIDARFPFNNFGIIFFKPPRATSPDIFPPMEDFFKKRATAMSLEFFGPFGIVLTPPLIEQIYLGDNNQPYWNHLNQSLSGRVAYVFLIRGDLSEEKISFLKGWVKQDSSRGRDLEFPCGLRGDFYQLLKIKGEEGVTTLENEWYQDNGVHAPISLTSRFRQLTILMAFCEEIRNQTRKLLFKKA